MVMPWRPIFSEKVRGLYTKFDEELDILLRDLDSVYKKKLGPFDFAENKKRVGEKFRVLLPVLIDNFDVNENNFWNYVHSLLDYLSEQEPKVKKLVDKEKVIPVRKQIEKVIEFKELEREILDEYIKYNRTPEGRPVWFDKPTPKLNPEDFKTFQRFGRRIAKKILFKKYVQKDKEYWEKRFGKKLGK